MAHMICMGPHHDQLPDPPELVQSLEQCRQQILDQQQVNI
jgi:hypothetical protein